MNFTINGNAYTAREFDYNVVCELEELGVPVGEMRKKPTATARAYFAICSGLDKDDAGTEIQEHIIKGGDLTELMKAMLTEMNESDFFQKGLNAHQKASEEAKAEVVKEMKKK